MRSFIRPILGGLAAAAIFASLPVLAGAAQAQTKKQPKAQIALAQTASDEKPNILFIMGDDIGFIQPRKAVFRLVQPGAHARRNTKPCSANGQGLGRQRSWHEPWSRTSSAILSSRRLAQARRRSTASAARLAVHLPPYDWNMLPIGQLLWEKELYSYKEFPPLQAPETYNLQGILDAMKKAGHPSD